MNAKPVEHQFKVGDLVTYTRMPRRFNWQQIEGWVFEVAELERKSHTYKATVLATPNHEYGNYAVGSCMSVSFGDPSWHIVPPEEVDFLRLELALRRQPC